MHPGLTILLFALAFVAALFLNGVFATIEDELPGGFNNPDGNRPESPSILRLRRIGGAIAIVGLGTIALGGARAALSDSLLADRVLDAGFAAGAALLGLAIILRLRPVFWAGALLIAIGVVGGIVLR